METIIRSFKINDLEGRETINFLPKIISKNDKMILERWCEFFDLKGVPFVVTVIKNKNQERYKLYKLERSNSEEMDTILFCKKDFKMEDE